MPEKKHPHIKKIIHSAAKRGLFVMKTGSGRDLKYEFWDRKTGKLVLTYYPVSERWLGVGKEGYAPNHNAALAAALDTVSHARDAP